MLSFFVALQALTVTITGRLTRPADADRGATAVEYGLMVALIAVVILSAVLALGGKLSGIFNTVATTI
ncbi:MAG: hypothetical protein NVS3B26_10240 [Mycobacteriales bacterium]